jgi:hypothetical protein
LPFALIAGNAQMFRRAMLKSAIVDASCGGNCIFPVCAAFRAETDGVMTFTDSGKPRTGGEG